MGYFLGIVKVRSREKLKNIKVQCSKITEKLDLEPLWVEPTWLIIITGNSPKGKKNYFWTKGNYMILKCAQRFPRETD